MQEITQLRNPRNWKSKYNSIALKSEITLTIESKSQNFDYFFVSFFSSINTTTTTWSHVKQLCLYPIVLKAGKLATRNRALQEPVISVFTGTLSDIRGSDTLNLAFYIFSLRMLLQQEQELEKWKLARFTAVCFCWFAFRDLSKVGWNRKSMAIRYNNSKKPN